MSSLPRRQIYLNPAVATNRCEFNTIEGLEEFHKSLPNYSPTPLVPLLELAKQLGVRAIFVKDESNRFGLPAFKVLGASWGCYRAIASRLDLPPTLGFEELSAKAKTVPVSLFAATEGNHGRAVAFIARLLSIEAYIYVPKSMDSATRGFISGEGAHVHVVDGDYDCAVREASTLANTTDGGILVQDTAFAGYESIPEWIVEGYSTMVREVEAQLSELSLESTVMITPVGVGSLAQAVARYCKSRPNPPVVVAVEPKSAAGLYLSLRAGKPVSVETSSTIMDGMNCGTVSSTAWPYLQRLVDACVWVSDYQSHDAIRYLKSQSVASGPCGGASLAGLRRLDETRERHSFLRSDSVVVLLSTEGPRQYPTPFEVAVDDPVSLTQVLTTIDSSNPTLSAADGAGESEIAKYLTAWFEYRKIECHRIETVPGRPSIIGIVRGTGGGKSLMFNGHIDTVSLASYENDPLSGALGERNGQQVILGRGSLDMKGGLAAALAAVSTTIRSGRIPSGDIIIATVSDEEDASQGTKDILAAGWRADAAVIPEPTMESIVTAHKGFVWIEVDILGVAAHGSLPSEGEDAILQAGWFLRALEQYQTRLPIDEILGQASLHCGSIRGGEEPSSYPAKCTITVEFRTVLGQTSDSILHDISAMLVDITKENPRFRYAEPRVTISRPMQHLSFDHPIAQKAADMSSQILGSRPTIWSQPFWCDAALLHEAGIPAIVFGPSGEGLHAKEEYVEVESVRNMEKIYVDLIQEFCR